MADKKYLFNNGKRINVVAPNTDDRDILFATEELRRVLTKATLAQVVVYSRVEMGDTGLISLGDSYLAKKNGIKTDLSEVGKQGYKIKTLNGNIFIYAATPIGVLNGVYGFLEKVVNYDYFYKDVMRYDYVPLLEFPELDITEVPDIQERIVSQGYQDFEYSELRRFRMVKYREVFPDVQNAGAFHNSFGYLPPSKHLKAHPEWYSDNIYTMRAHEGQICYTAHGDKKSYALMVEEVSKVLVDTLSSVKHNEVVMATNDAWLDWNENCTCPACTAEKEKYGSYAGSIIKFLNAVSDKAELLFKEAGNPKADTFQIVFYAYHQTAVPPVIFKKDKDGRQVYDKTGKPAFTYEPEVKLGKHVNLVYARGWCDLIRGFYHPKNRRYLDEVVAWQELNQKEMCVWTYDRYFDQGGVFIPYNSFSSIKSLYKFTKEYNVRWLYNEACNDNQMGTAFTLLKGYLQSKLGWKTDLDVEMLEKKFFDAMYGTQSKAMYSVYKDVLAYSKRQTEEESFPLFNGSREVLYPVRWDKDVLYDFLKRMEAAEKALIANGELKEAQHVKIEQMYPIGVLVRCCRDEFTKKEFTCMLKKLRDYMFEYNLITLGSGELNWPPKFCEMLGMTNEEIWANKYQKGGK